MANTFDTAKMAQLLDAYFAQLLENKRIPGCGLKVRKDGQLVYDQCVGVADLESNLPVAEKTIFALASMTKPIVAVAIMKLVEAGKLSLDDHLLKFFPHYPEEKRAVTVRHLLSHCSGLGQGAASNRHFATHICPGESLADRIDRMQDIPFDFQPGESGQYSPIVGFEILGRIVEIACGMQLGEYLSVEIFQPLGMHDTGFYLSEEQRKRTAKVYSSANGQLMPFPVEKTAISLTKANAHYNSGCGGLYGTLYDYDRFTTMLAFNGQLDGVRILSEESVKLMRTSRQLTEATPYPGSYWGLGMMVFEQPEKTNISVAPGTFGWSGAFGTHMFISPTTGISATYMVNMGDLGGASSPVSRQIEKIIFADFLLSEDF